jgi:hypothetical protein
MFLDTFFYVLERRSAARALSHTVLVLLLLRCMDDIQI